MMDRMKKSTAFAVVLVMLLALVPSTMLAEDNSGDNGDVEENGEENGDRECAAVVEEGESIQKAVEDAEEGDTICVEEGDYRESITVDVEDLTLKSLEGAENTEIEAGEEEAFVVEIAADGVTLEGFTLAGVAVDEEGDNEGKACGVLIADEVSGVTVTGCEISDISSEEGGACGIYAENPEGMVLENNRVSDVNGETAAGIVLDGETLETSVNENTLEEIEGEEKAEGIRLIDAVDVNVTHNDVTGIYSGGDTAAGILLEGQIEDLLAAENSIEEVASEEENGAAVLVGDDAALHKEDEEDEENGENGEEKEVTLKKNNIFGNDIGVYNRSEDVLDARDNWWGDESGPGSYDPDNEYIEDPVEEEKLADGEGDIVSENVRFYPWKEEPIEEEEPADLETSVRITPSTFNLRAGGRWVNAFVVLPEDVSSEVDMDTVRLVYEDEEVPVDWGLALKYGLNVKFDRAETANMLEDETGEVELLVRGEIDGETFEAKDVIRVIMPGPPEDRGPEGTPGPPEDVGPPGNDAGPPFEREEDEEDEDEEELEEEEKDNGPPGWQGGPPWR